jgi:CRISPR-associated endonuclease Csn1
LWLEQKYRSPYTGEIIPLNKLFTTEYEIEHVIPQSRYFDDSYTNKVICEAAINRLKGNQLGMEFIQTHRGEVVELGLGKTARVFAVEDYKNFVARHYSRNHAKRTRLLLEDIPEQMIERQLNDTRYISKYVSGLLSSIVRSAQNDDGINSKNLIPGNGKITTQLKQDWGLNDVWNDIVLPRFERLNKLTGTNDYTTWSDRHQKFIPTVPLALAKGFSKKRIDHRHHALDALVIATMTRDHVNLINNQYANSEKRFDLSRKLRNYETVQYEDFKTKELITREVPREFRKPWATFTQDAQRALERVIISFKQNLRVINKATNHYTKWIDENGVKVKRKVPQEGANWAIRKPLHKDTVSGKVNLKWVKVPKGKILTATRKPLDSNIDAKSIESITDTGIQKILKRYLAAKGGDPEVAFSPEGVEELNRNISLYNEGKQHKPIRKVRVFESGSKFALGNSGNKNTKYVEAAKGTNLYFGVYIDTAGKRSFETIPLNIVIERIKQGLSPIAEVDEKGRRLNICLSPNDLVQIPAKVNEVSINGHILNPGSIYKVVSFSGGQIFFVLHTVSRSVVDKVEFSALNKMERSIDGQMIKDVCIKYSVSRLGTIHT